jgi:hypothetical protein
LELYLHTALVDIFQNRMGEILPPLISAMWGVDVKPRLASKILPHIFRLLTSLTTFMR